MRKGQSPLKVAADVQLRTQHGTSLDDWVMHKLNRGVSWSRIAVDLERATEGVKISRQTLANWYRSEVDA